MATLNGNGLTLLDIAKRKDPDGKVAKVAELLTETNGILDDAVFVECNDGTSHRTTVRTGLPAVAWRKLNYGVPNSKSRTAQVKDSAGMLETYSKTDKALIDMSGDPGAVRMSEDRAFIEAMNQEMATTMFYGDTSVHPERFLGLAPRYNDLSAENGDNIIDAGGTGADNTSIWLVVWGENTCHGIYPNGSQGGISHRDLGEDTANDGNGGEYQIYRTHYKWDCGLTVRDWRYVVRIANVDVSALTKDASAGADLIDLMVQAVETLPGEIMGRASFYANRTVRSFLRRQITNKDNVWLNMGEVAGKKVVQFDDIPVRRTDAILNTEERVV